MAEPEPEPVPWLPKEDLAYYGPFRDNVKTFIKNETEADDYYIEGGVLGHTVTLATGTRYEAKLRVYEETMLDSTRVHCDCCRCIGWHHHPVTRKQYHFIIHTDFRTDLKPELKGKRICQLCTAALPEKDKVCAACGENDSETSILDYQTHLMHGMLHANGCGHLKRINGREAGSRVLSGQQLIQIWEKICNTLRAREVSVEDVSQKYGVEFRLLNPVACGKTWYGTYGYEFGKGSFGNTAVTHRKAAERLRGFPLASVKSDFAAMTKGSGGGGGGGAAGGTSCRGEGGAGTSNGGTSAGAGPSSAGGAGAVGDDKDDGVLAVITRYEKLMGTRYAPKTLGALVALLLRLQRIVRRNEKGQRLAELRAMRREGRKSGGGRAGISTVKLQDGFGAGLWEMADVVEAEIHSADRATKWREEEAKRKASSAASLFEPLKFATKKASKLAKGNNRAAAASKVMSSAKPLKLPTRPLRPRGADGLVPSSAPVVKEEPVSDPVPSTSPTFTIPPPPPAKKQKKAEKEKKTEKEKATAGGGKGAKGGGGAAAAGVGSSPSPPLGASRWSDARIETAANACVEVLREARGKWMPRQEVRALARAKGVGDTGLLDHVLKSISEQKVVLTKGEGKQNKTKDNKNDKNAKSAKGAKKGGVVSIRAHIRRQQNSSTGQLEYHLESVPGMAKMRAHVVVSAAAKKAAKARAEAAAVAAAAAAATATQEVKGKGGKGRGKKGQAAAATKVEAKQPQVEAKTTKSAVAVKSEGKNGGLTDEQAVMEAAARQLRKDDLDRDVKTVYKNLLESYKPARPRPGRPSKASLAASRGGSGAVTNSKCKGGDLIDAARVLLDTKQFVKTYVPVEDLLTLRPPPPKGPGGKGGRGGRPPMTATGLRVLVTAVIDTRNCGPKVSGLTGKAAKKLKHGIETKPPPEVVLLPPDPLMSDLKKAADKAFQELYVVLAKFKVKTVVGFEGLADKTRLGPKKIAGAKVEVHGEGADLESEFRYQGGLDQWVVRCVCGTCDDDGERMIACDACEVWMHTRCVGISDTMGTPRRWTCVECQAEAEEEAAAAAVAVPAAPPPGRPPPTVRRPLPEKILKKRKGSKR